MESNDPYLLENSIMPLEGDKEETTEVQENESTLEPEDIAEEGINEYQPYYDLLDEIAAGLQNGFTDEQVIGGLEISTRFFGAMNAPYEILGWMMMDLDGDGIDELLLGENAPEGEFKIEGWDSIIYDIYTIKNGNIVHVASGAERCRYHLCDDGTIAREGSSGASYTSYEYYRYLDGELRILESIFSDMDQDMNTIWHQSSQEAYIGNPGVITQEEALQMVEDHVYQKLEFTCFEYEVIQDYY